MLNRSSMALVWLVFALSGCASVEGDALDEESRELPHAGNSSAVISVDGVSYVGAFVATLLSDGASFSFSGHNEVGEAVNGTIHFAPESEGSSAAERRYAFSAENEWDWLYQNRGSFGLSTGEGGAQYVVRRFEYQATAEGLELTVDASGILVERLDSESRTIRAGDDVSLAVSGRVTFLSKR